MERPCKRISAYAAQCLMADREYRMLSRFDHVVNLVYGAEVLSVQDTHVAMSPLSVVLEDGIFQEVFSGLSDGAVFDAAGGCLVTGGLSLDARHLTPCTLRIPKGCLDSLGPEEISWLRMAAGMLSKPGSLLYAGCPELAAWSGEAPNAVQLRALELLRSGEADALVGLGGGLTPAGDDFLTGLLAVLWACGGERSVEWLALRLRKRLSETPVLSRAFLERAVEGAFSQPVIELFIALAQGAQGTLVQAVSRLCAIGHTSGCDLLGGILYGLIRFPDKI